MQNRQPIRLRRTKPTNELAGCQLPVVRFALRLIAAKIIRPRLRPREAARRQPAVRWAAAGHPLRGIAVQRVAPCQACGMTPAWRRPQADDQEQDGPTPPGTPWVRRGSVAARRPRGAPGGGKHTVVRAANEFS